MKDYFLFVDTETSGLPKKWNQPYWVKGNWPYSVQIAWLIFDKSGAEVKRENFYIGDEDFDIQPASIKIHGITREFLKQNGTKRKKVMNKLAYDIRKYRPLLVGHFMELDYHVLGADFYRSQVDNPMKKLPLFCTMLASEIFVKNPQSKFFRLPQLHEHLFDQGVDNIHDALTDAEITAKCFFELKKRGTITDTSIAIQQTKFRMKALNTTGKVWGLVALLATILVIIIILFAL